MFEPCHGQGFAQSFYYSKSCPPISVDTIRGGESCYAHCSVMCTVCACVWRQARPLEEFSYPYPQPHSPLESP